MQEIGFGGKLDAGKPKSESERILEQLVESDKDPYSNYRGKYVEVIGQGVEIIGVYRGIRDVEGFHEIVFSPFVSSKATPAPTRENPGRNLRYYELSEGFAFLNLHAVGLITPQDEEYILSFIRNSRKIAGIDTTIIV